MCTQVGPGTAPLNMVRIPLEGPGGEGEQGRNPWKIESRRRGPASWGVVGDMFPTSALKTALLSVRVERRYRPSKSGGRTSPFLPPRFTRAPGLWSPRKRIEGVVGKMCMHGTTPPSQGKVP